jgi:hypothetical protein
MESFCPVRAALTSPCSPASRCRSSQIGRPAHRLARSTTTERSNTAPPQSEGDSVLGQMLRLMQEAQASRAPTQQLADKVSAIFVPIVLGLAVATFLAWLAFDHGNLSFAFAAAVTVLVIACPCAMGLAVPAALTVAIGRGAQLGILIQERRSPGAASRHRHRRPRQDRNPHRRQTAHYEDDCREGR